MDGIISLAEWCFRGLNYGVWRLWCPFNRDESDRAPRLAVVVEGWTIFCYSDWCREDLHLQDLQFSLSDGAHDGGSLA